MSNTRLVPGLMRAGFLVCSLLGGAAIFSVLMATPVRAADLPVAPVYKAPVAVAAASWTGFYAGLGFGFRSSESDPTMTDQTSTLTPTTLTAFCNRFVAAGGCVTSAPVNGTTLRVSPYAGFNWQLSSSWVVGIEGEVGFGDQKTALSGAQYPLTVFNVQSPNDSFAVKTTWDASARARLGLLVNPAVMVYATGGPAWMHIESTSTCDPQPIGTCRPVFGLQPSVITHSTDKLGWTVGGGVEAMVRTNWFLRGEYRYSDYGTISNTDHRVAGTDITTNSYDLRVKTHTATLGLAYRFWDGNGAAQAVAAISPPQPVAGWTGPYLGLGAGVRSSRTNVDNVAIANFPCLIPRGCISSDPFNDTAARVSPYIGWNWQFASQWVAGLEGDFGFADKTTTIPGLYYPNTLTGFNGTAGDYFSIRTTWDASVRARLGYLVTSANLVYLTGGASWLHVDTNSVCSILVNCRPGVDTPSVISNSGTKLGWTVGGGFETRLWQNWTARAEYRYADYGRTSYTDTRQVLFIPDVETVSYDVHIRTHTFTLGLAYQFDTAGPVVAKY